MTVQESVFWRRAGILKSSRSRILSPKLLQHGSFIKKVSPIVARFPSRHVHFSGVNALNVHDISLKFASASTHPCDIAQRDNNTKARHVASLYKYIYFFSYCTIIKPNPHYSRWSYILWSMWWHIQGVSVSSLPRASAGLGQHHLAESELRYVTKIVGVRVRRVTGFGGTCLLYNIL